MPSTNGTVRIAAIADIHYTKTSGGSLQSLFARIAEQADILLLCGDLTDYGLPEEAHILARDLHGLKLPMIGVLGNHDYEAGQPDEVVRILTEAGVTMLDGATCEFEGVSFAGVKGFAGGFGRGTLGYWGEPEIKSFVQTGIDEALKLESALARLRTEQRIAVLHYAPIQATVEGEPVEIFPWLGSGRLEEPLTRYPVAAVFHGHAHGGSPEGTTSNGTPVYNVSLSLLQRHLSEEFPVRMLELPRVSDA